MSVELSELEQAYYSSIKELKQGTLVKGEIVAISPQGVVVDVGYKSEGIIPCEEFRNIEELKESQEIEVYVENVEDEEGKIVLSYERAQEVKGWKELSSNYKEGDLVDGIVSRRVKGGYMVKVFYVEGFLPRSLSAFRKNDTSVIGKNFYFQIIKMNRPKRNFIVSRRDAIQKEKNELREKIWKEIEIGQRRTGRVKSITNFGVFIDLGGVDGLLHIADMSWKKISHPSEMVAVGDNIEIIVLNFDKEQGKISLGLKQIMPDPWQKIEDKYPVSSTIRGKIVNIQNYGLFVELEKGIEGLVHISEISWTKRFVNLSDSFAIGDMVEAKIIGIEPQAKKISLSIKQLEHDPWEDIESMISIGAKVKGKVVGFGENCAYLELKNGLEGVVYNQNLSWTRRINRAQEVLRRSHVYEFKVLGLNKDIRKVVLGRKQLTSDPWPEIVERYPIGRVVEGEIVKNANFGVFVKLEDELEGLVFGGEIDDDLKEKLEPGDKLNVKIIKVNPESAKIGLSANIEDQLQPEEVKQSQQQPEDQTDKGGSSQQESSEEADQEEEKTAEAASEEDSQQEPASEAEEKEED